MKCTNGKRIDCLNWDTEDLMCLTNGVRVFPERKKCVFKEEESE